ncbi:membrane protein [Leptospira kobayashii]|uniref:Membrane protein n=1 Tax=Leptospira kobayashii TaxID=1917830 RepID=A0ABN6KE91_9LEPT|nr:LA_2444/LA_4059 family outer membrane protein [Leptospira kobayashii]BDA78006.1 membrane protein [Leptospira kobayashii]
MNFRVSYFWVVLFLFGWCVCSLYGEENGVENTVKKEKTSSFELLLKRQTYDFAPYEYTSLTKNPPPNQTSNTGKLSQNSKVLIPFVFSYENYKKNYRLEISYFEMEIVNPNSLVLRTDGNQISMTREYLKPVTRSELKANAYLKFPFGKDWNFYSGGGIRNINKYKYGNYLGEGAFQEYFFTYGPQLSIKSVYSITSEIQFSVGLDGFYTQGNRFVKDPILNSQTFTLPIDTAGTEGIYRGYELDLSLSYRFAENFKFYIGYNRIESKFSYLHFHQINVNYSNSQWNGNDFSLSGFPSISKPIQSGNFETLKGFYLGGSVHF